MSDEVADVVSDDAPVEGEVAEVSSPDAAVSETSEPSGEAVSEEIQVAELPENFAAQVQEWGGVDKLQEAVEVHKALYDADPNGRVDLFVELGKSFGLGTDKLEQLFATDEPAAAGAGTEVEEEDEDRVLTLKEARELLAKEVIEPQRAQLEAQSRAAGEAAFASTMAELGVTDPAQQQVIAQFGDSALAPAGEFPTADEIASAIKAGYAKWEQVVEEQSKKYIADKRRAAETTPGPLGSGGSPGGEAPPDPTSLEEAKRRVRESLGL